MVALTVRRRYSNWLIELVGYDSTYGYGGMLALAFETKFKVSKYVKQDVTRAMDGLELRSEFERSTGLQIPALGECNILELLISIAIRMNDTAWEPANPNRTKEFFWILIANLNLDMWPNERLGIDGDREVHLIFEVLNDRAYAPDGSDGGLFPLKNAESDQRDVEIWYQMMSWFLERKN